MPTGSVIGVKITFSILPSVSFASKRVSSLPTLRQGSDGRNQTSVGCGLPHRGQEDGGRSGDAHTMDDLG